MSSTTNVQNLLVNVFRPVYRYDATTTAFTPKLELSNIDTVSGNSIAVFTAAVGDVSSNVYVGSNAGNLYSTLNGCQYVTALGVNAANSIFNVTNSVFVGYNAGGSATNASGNVSVGANTSGNGSSNVRIGSSSTGTGSSNVSLGASTSSSTYSNCILLGPGVTATQDKQFRVGTSYLYGDMSTNWLGVGTATPANSNSKLDVSGNVYVTGQVGLNMIPTRTLDVNGNFRSADAHGTLDFFDGVTSSLNGFASVRGSSSVDNLSNVSIGTLKNGLVLVAVRSGATNFDGRTSFILDTTAPTVSNLSSTTSGTTTVNFTSNSINISNTSGGALTYSWTITYFPL